MPHVAKAGLGLAFIFIVYQIYFQLTVGRKRRAIQRQKGTLPAPWFSGFRDHVMGLDLFRQNIQALKEHRGLETAGIRFAETGSKTMHMVLLGTHVYFTMEPENLKTIQAVDFKKWGLGTRRKVGFRPLLGDGPYNQEATQSSF